MILPVSSIVIYSLLVILLFAGRINPVKGKFNEGFLSLEATKGLKGLCALCVLLHHISQDQAFQSTGEVSLFLNIGFLFVGVFFFCSGYGLLKSFDSKPDYFNGFWKRRFLPILVAYVVMNLIYALWHVIIKTHMEPSEWVCRILGICLMNDQSWFAVVILIMYASFYFAFKRIGNRFWSFAFILCVTLLQLGLFLFLRHFAWWSGPKGWWLKPGAFQSCAWWQRPCALWFSGEWWVNSTIMFFVGMLVAAKEKPVTEWFKVHYPVKICITLILALAGIAAGLFALFNWGYWREFAGDNSVTPRLITLCFQIVEVFFFVTAVFAVMMKHYAVNKVLNFLGGLSLEIYLMQRIALNTFTFIVKPEYGFNPALLQGRFMMLAYIAAVSITTLIFALAFKKINACIVKFISRS